MEEGVIMLYKIAQDFPNDMILGEEGPLISLYQPTHRHFPENKRDKIVFKNLMREIENSLKRDYKRDMIESIMKPLYQIEKDLHEPFWNNTLDGIAVFASKNKCIVYHLFVPVKEFAVVANSFHIKPLIQAFQSLDKYQLLGLSRNSFAMFQGDKNGFVEIELGSDVPRTLEEVLGDQLTEPYLSYASYGGIGDSPMYHGHGDSTDEIAKDTEKYYRYIDRFILENYSNKSRLPLILVSLKENQSQFRKISRNPYLHKEAIDISYEAIEIEQLNKMALEIIEPDILKETKKVIESYNSAASKSLGSFELSEVVKAAFEGQVETLLLEENRIIAGKIDKNSGIIYMCDIDNPDCDDILDDLAELVLKNKGNIVVLPKDKMPSTTGIAAIYRYS